jgi:hypothetical protein
MVARPPSPVPFPLSSFPGSNLEAGRDNNQESSGRIINRYVEALGEPQPKTGPAPYGWRRCAGLTRHAATTQTGYRGGLIVNNISYEVWANELLTIDAGGVVTVLGTVNGTAKVSIARDLAGSIDVVVVDPAVGAFSSTGGGAPAAYNGGGNLPAPNSVFYQDGIFHFTIADGRVFGSGVNALTQNALTFVKLQSLSDVTLLRGIPYNGMAYFFTTGGCEVWSDTAAAFPAYPYSKFMTLPFGLVQANAIAGWETGFQDLMWVAQDFAVYRLVYNTLQPGPSISPPALNTLIGAAVRAGQQLEAGVRIEDGKKFWTLSSPNWTWEINLSTMKWSERTSLNAATGLQGRWRGTGGHNAFGKWLLGDIYSGNLLFSDPTNFTEDGAPLLARMESGPVKDFPHQLRIARADFDFVFGAGINVNNVVTNVTGAAADPVTGNVILQVTSTAQMRTGDQFNVASVTGTVEANGSWAGTVIDGTHIEIPVPFVHAWVSGGTVTDVTSPANKIAPSCAISCSKDGGVTWDNPSIRAIGNQQRTKGVRASVKSRGLSGTQGVRWRVDCSDPTYDMFLGGTMSSDPREVGK